MQTTSSIAILRERRNLAEREALPRRVWREFVEMPCLRLSEAQARRLFALRADECHRILTGLVEARALIVGPDGRYHLPPHYWDVLAHPRLRPRVVAC